MTKYQITKSVITVEAVTAESYGIECLCSNITVKRIDDISLNREKIEKLVQLMNRLEVSPIHFEDIIEDEI